MSEYKGSYYPWMDAHGTRTKGTKDSDPPPGLSGDAKTILRNAKELGVPLDCPEALVVMFRHGIGELRDAFGCGKKNNAEKVRSQFLDLLQEPFWTDGMKGVHVLALFRKTKVRTLEDLKHFMETIPGALLSDKMRIGPVGFHGFLKLVGPQWWDGLSNRALKYFSACDIWSEESLMYLYGPEAAERGYGDPAAQLPGWLRKEVSAWVAKKTGEPPMGETLPLEGILDAQQPPAEVAKEEPGKECKAAAGNVRKVIQAAVRVTFFDGEEPRMTWFPAWDGEPPDELAVRVAKSRKKACVVELLLPGEAAARYEVQLPKEWPCRKL
jgi:hypothetical protein